VKNLQQNFLHLAFSDIFELKAGPVKGKSLQQKILLNMKKRYMYTVKELANVRTQKAKRLKVDWSYT